MQNPLPPHQPQLAPALQFGSSFPMLQFLLSLGPLPFSVYSFFNASLCFRPFHFMGCVSTVGIQKDWDMFSTYYHKMVPKNQIFQRAVYLKRACNTRMKRPQGELSIWKFSVSYFIMVSTEHVWTEFFQMYVIWINAVKRKGSYRLSLWKGCYFLLHAINNVFLLYFFLWKKYNYTFLNNVILLIVIMPLSIAVKVQEKTH